ncbi:polysaccharide deacetylase family protein [Actinoplanes oblitus]|uniref:Polysaccharide deacetylase family protein n=1 Tax=Actinoplanes oblitus TaxID=3040509 RepID=A0ABY8WJT5_9ACTN|nr:polysaccharide deacetylase family protein [Actinoplanes oblitus]WIM97368.1 polysaccharide deacetylase family protein [Actinoplanes oblitus]
MRLSHTRKALLISMSLIMLGLVGQAAAAESSHSEAAPPAVATPAIATPATSDPATGTPAAKPTTKPAPTPTKTKPRTESTAIPKHPKGRTGPGGSRLTTGTKDVALTFDDGPDPANTPALLKILAKEKVKATFCLVGENVKRHPDLVRKIAAGGHALCNHTWNHDLRLGKKKPAQIRADMERTNAAIRAAVPNAKISYFRAPGGNFTSQIVKTAKQLGMSSIYWKVDPRDWEHGKTESDGAHTSRVISSVKRHTHPGAIVLSHDYAQPDTIRAYRVLIPYLRKRFHLIALP